MSAKIKETDNTSEAAELYSATEAKERERRELLVEVENAKTALKLAKEAYDRCVEQLCALAGTRLETPLFDQQEDE